jgi:uracil-DNA glycosylase family 4
MRVRSETSNLDRIHARVVACTRCPELRTYCREVSRVRKREFSGETYWGKPVPGLGDENARLLIVGLAPAAHGGNRTGRMFTGDSSGAWLARAMHAAGFATKPTSLRRGDGFLPIDAYITAALRCAPPANRPTREQLANCAGHMLAELGQLRRIRVVIGLGKIGFDAAVGRLKEAGYAHGPRRPRFAHGAEFRLEPPTDRQPLVLLGSYHPSRQNTNTGRLTAAMLGSIFRRARQLLKYR